MVSPRTCYLKEWRWSCPVWKLPLPSILNLDRVSSGRSTHIRVWLSTICVTSEFAESSHFFHTLTPKRNWWVIFSFLELGRLRYGCKEEEEDGKRRKHRCFWAWPWSKVIIPHSHILLKAPNLKHCHSSGNAAFLQSLWVSFLSICYPKTLEALDIAVSSSIKEVPILLF